MSRCEQPENLNRCLVQNISTISAGYGLLTLVNEVITPCGQPIRNRALVTLVVDTLPSPCCYC